MGFAIRRSVRWPLLLVSALAFGPAWTSGQTPASAPAHEMDGLVRGVAAGCREKAVKFLLQAQESGGGWHEQSGPGVTCLVLRALVREPSVGPEHEAVRRGLHFLERFWRDDGGLYAAEGLHNNYETSVALSLYSLFPRERFGERVQKMQKYLTGLQWDESEGRAPSDVFYGGAGYGNGKRPDLSNTQIMLDALHDSGLGKDDPAWQRAMVFIQRCQMRSESNDQPFASASRQGGFIYSPANGGESKAGEILVGEDRTELRCYGSMTYAGFKSMLYAGLSRDDPRVVAAVAWVRKYWTVEENPNVPGQKSQEGLFYYYHTLARALSAWGEDVIVDRIGKPHIWRQELVAQLQRRQRADGSWANERDRWMEGVPALATAYSLLALQEAYGTK
jgi:squalene-hopene/tetraprenyl-beta-curcumene cyclase